jgi:hypothetical protein
MGMVLFENLQPLYAKGDMGNNYVKIVIDKNKININIPIMEYLKMD